MHGSSLRELQIFGKKDGFYDIHLGTLDISIGFRILGESASVSGFAVGGLGDINGDGYDDIIIGALGGLDTSGKSYVLLGREIFYDISLSSLNGTQGFRILGESRNDYSGASVSGAGDINGDGYSDLLIGAPHNQDPRYVGAGKSYVIFGSDGSTETPTSVPTLSPSPSPTITPTSAPTPWYTYLLSIGLPIIGLVGGGIYWGYKKGWCESYRGGAPVGPGSPLFIHGAGAEAVAYDDTLNSEFYDFHKLYDDSESQQDDLNDWLCKAEEIREGLDYGC